MSNNIGIRLKQAEALTLEACHSAITAMFRNLNTSQLERLCTLMEIDVSRELTGSESIELDKLLALVNQNAMTEEQADFLFGVDAELAALL